MTSGFIGLGRMGGAMATRLALAGHDVMVFDVNPGAVAAMVAVGATEAESVPAMACRAQDVFLSLPSLETVEDVVLGRDGLVCGSTVRTIVDLSTSGPGLALKLAAGLRKQGIDLIDAPVSGGIAGARAGKLSLMVSGPERAFEAVRAARFGADSDFTIVTKVVEAAAGLDPERAAQPVI